jgi:uncharacterized protein Yka (UPF0111/DUF47 family)
MGFLDSVFRNGFEKSIMGESSRIIVHAINANMELRKVINGSGSIKRIKEIEEESDKAVFRISNSITSGGMPPNIIPDLLRFMDFEDNIVDSIFNMARAYARYTIKDKKINDYLQKQLIAMNGLSESALDILLKMHKATTIETAHRLRYEIEKYEQRGDEIKDAMLAYAYNSKMDYKAFNHILDMAYLSDDVQDNCEDVADRLVTIFVSIIS